MGQPLPHAGQVVGEVAFEQQHSGSWWFGHKGHSKPGGGASLGDDRSSATLKALLRVLMPQFGRNNVGNAIPRDKQSARVNAVEIGHQTWNDLSLPSESSKQTTGSCCPWIHDRFDGAELDLTEGFAPAPENGNGEPGIIILAPRTLVVCHNGSLFVGPLALERELDAAVLCFALRRVVVSDRRGFAVANCSQA